MNPGRNFSSGFDHCCGFDFIESGSVSILLDESVAGKDFLSLRS
jgi:hypothetical protein